MTDDNKRSIRFKEWGVLMDSHKRPKPEQLEGSDGTLLDDEFRLRTNNEGYIVSGNDLPDVGGKPKLITLGGSFVEALYAHETDRFGSQMERNLNSSGMNLEVWNGGYSGSTLLHSFNVFINKVIPSLRYVDQVFIFTAMSDQRTQVHTDSYWIKDKTHAPIIEARNSNVAQNRDATTEDQERLLSLFVIAARAYKHEPIIVASPYRAAPFNDDDFTRKLHKTPEVYAESLLRLNMINDTARKVSRRLSATLWDADKELHGSAKYFYDSMHLNSAGQEKMAGFLSDKYMQHIRQAGL